MMSTATAEAFPDLPEVKRRDWTIIGVVGIAHAMSHFFQLILPTLYISLAAEYGYDYVQLGSLVSAFFLVSCLGQASSGFVVDRIGGAPVLHFGLACFALSAVLIGASTGYVTLLIAAVIGGIGNSVFHPVDYSILNQRVSPRRLGHAFSAHGLTGNLGWALTPVFMSTIIYLADWRVAAFSAAVLIGAVLWLTWLARRLLAGPTQRVQAREDQDEEQASGSASAGGKGSSVLATLSELVSQPALWGAFLFFAFTSIAFSAVQNYTIPLMGEVYGIDKVLAGTTLSGYMLAAAAGMVLGGFLVGANPRTELTVAAALVASGLTLVFLAMGWLPPYVAVALVGVAGFCSGVAAPSRDMLIRRVTPKKAVGTVYGLVYSGMDVGASLGPVLFGLMLDAGLRQGPWFGAGAAFAVSAFLAIWVARTAAKRKEGLA